MAKKSYPDKGQLEFEAAAQGQTVAGIDEVGRGCIAGPVVTAIVILDYLKLQALDDKQIALIRDSKTLSTRQRQQISPVIKQISLACELGSASVREIEKHGILGATFVAMKRCIAKLAEPVDLLFVDGNQMIPDYEGKQLTLIDGDSRAFAIAAASILAKEARDDYMRQQAKRFPAYGFESHVGYGTKKHMDALKEVGVCPLHRKNFAPVSRALGL